MPLLRPLAALLGAPDPARGPVGPDVFDDATGDSHPWVAAIALVLRGHWALNLGQRHAQAEADFLAAPVRTARSIPSRATVSPNRLASPSATIE
jgi:hypothetical protein